MEETGLNGWVYDFSVDYYSVDVDGIFDIHRYLMKSIDEDIVWVYKWKCVLGYLALAQ